MDDNPEIEEETEYEKNFPECYKYLLERDKENPNRYKEYFEEEDKERINPFYSLGRLNLMIGGKG
jgi:hypothetical protein